MFPKISEYCLNTYENIKVVYPVNRMVFEMKRQSHNSVFMGVL